MRRFPNSLDPYLSLPALKSSINSIYWVYSSWRYGRQYFGEAKADRLTIYLKYLISSARIRRVLFDQNGVNIFMPNPLRGICAIFCRLTLKLPSSVFWVRTRMRTSICTGSKCRLYQVDPDTRVFSDKKTWCKASGFRYFLTVIMN